MFSNLKHSLYTAYAHILVDHDDLFTLRTMVVVLLAFDGIEAINNQQPLYEVDSVDFYVVSFGVHTLYG